MPLEWPLFWEGKLVWGRVRGSTKAFMCTNSLTTEVMSWLEYTPSWNVGKRWLMLEGRQGWKQFNLQGNHDCSGTCTCAESPIYGILAPGELPTPVSFTTRCGEIQHGCTTHFQNPMCGAFQPGEICQNRSRVSFWPRGIYEYRIVGLVQILNMSL